MVCIDFNSFIFNNIALNEMQLIYGYISLRTTEDSFKASGPASKGTNLFTITLT